MPMIYCDCMYSTIISQEKKDEIKQTLAESQESSIIIPDLCQWVAEKNSNLATINWEESIVIACYPRAIQWLLRKAGIAKSPKDVWNMKELSATSIQENIKKMEKSSSSGLPLVERKEHPNPNDWVPWFPVIDYERCHNCKQCLNFCLFGVYIQEQGKVVVANPQSCKNNCPACARICPTCAIIFPKCPETPLQGAPVPSDYRPTELNQVLGSNPHLALLERRKKAKNILLEKKKKNS